MVNASVASPTYPFSYFDCLKKISFGFVWFYISVFLCFLVGTPAHSWNVWLLLRVGFKIKPTQVFPLILNTVELFFCLHLSIDILNIFVFQSLTGTFLTFFFFGMLWTCRLLIQMCICIEQYMAVIYPVVFLRCKAIHYRISAATTIWIMTSGYGLSLAFGVFVFPDDIFMFTCLTGLTMILFCYVSVLCALKHSGPSEREVTEDRDVQNQQKRNAFNTISSLLLIIVLSYLPLLSMAIFGFMNLEINYFHCDIVPAMLSVNIYSIMVPPLLKLCKSYRR